jgi:hypothetical protein
MTHKLIAACGGVRLSLATAQPPAVSAMLMGWAQSLNLDTTGAVQDLSVNLEQAWLYWANAFFLKLAIIPRRV